MADDSTRPALARETGLPLFDRYDPRVVQELAVGVDDDLDVLARYGFTGAQATALLEDPILKTEVAALTQELRRAGTTAKIKARIVAEELIGSIWLKMKDGTRSVAEMLDVLKVLAKIGDLEPRDTGGKMTGTIVRVDLNFGSLGMNPPPQRATIHAQTQTADALDHQGIPAYFDVEARPVVDVPDEPDAPAPTVELHIDGSIAACFLGMEIEAL